MRQALAKHWPEYLMEAAGLGLFMISAGVLATALQAPASPLRQALDEPLLRRALMGVGIGATAVGLIYSPWGRRSGAHLNPAVTLVFLRLGKIAPWDAFFYVVSQFLGGLAGVWIALLLLGAPFAADPVRFVVTVPGRHGSLVAFVAELVIALGLMSLILATTNSPRLARYTGLFAGALLALYILIEDPFSGMSLNPARTVASALPAGLWTSLWVYLTAPLAGMLLAAEIYLRRRSGARIYCAKLNHGTGARCIFRCRHSDLQREAIQP